RLRSSRANPDELAEKIRERNGNGPFFMIYLDGWDTTGKYLRDFVKGLDDSCVLVSPTEMSDLMRRWASVYAKAQDISSQPDKDEGLSPVSNGDGAFTIVERDGVRCWQVPKQQAVAPYFYLSVDGLFRAAVLEIELEYFDTGSGDIALDYDSIDV